MSPEEIHNSIQASIRPQLDFADARLDYYTEGLPPEAWQPIARQLRPPLTPDTTLTGTLQDVGHALDLAINSFLDLMKSPLMQQDLTTTA